MQRPTIPDKDVPGTDPDTLIFCFTPFLQKIANRYKTLLVNRPYVDNEDLIQAGIIGLLKAQKKYDPAAGSGFLHFSFNYIRNAMRKEIGFNCEGEPPPVLDSLDRPISESDPESSRMMDVIADPNAVPLDEPITEEETRRETSEEIQAALDRMKSDKQRKAVMLVWIEGKTKQAAAESMEMKQGAFYSLEAAGRSTLRRDFRLKRFAETMPFVHIGAKRFNTTWTSATEFVALWRLEHLQQTAQEQPAEGTSAADRIRMIWNMEHGENK